MRQSDYVLKQYLVTTINNLNMERQPGILLVKIDFADTMIENGTSKKFWKHCLH